MLHEKGQENYCDFRLMLSWRFHPYHNINWYKKIPNKIELSASDPFLEYLGFIYNAGVEYMQQSEDMLHEIESYQGKLNDHMVSTKLSFMLSDGKNSKKK